MANDVILHFGDGTFRFQLRMVEIEALQKSCGDGLGVIADRLFHSRFKYSDIRETIRLGLIGGGMDPVKAKERVETYVDGQPLARSGDLSSPMNTALAIMMATFYGIAEAAEGSGNPPPDSKATPESTSQNSEPSSSTSESTRAA